VIERNRVGSQREFLPCNRLCCIVGRKWVKSLGFLFPQVTWHHKLRVFFLCIISSELLSRSKQGDE
jgi:hypothetical protein